MKEEEEKMEKFFNAPGNGKTSERQTHACKKHLNSQALFRSQPYKQHLVLKETILVLNSITVSYFSSLMCIGTFNKFKGLI